MKLVVLGSGTSHGIPVIGCNCDVCRSVNPKDKRMRASLYVKGSNGETAVIDTGPEFRLQALGVGIQKLDAVFITHDHADHIHGLDDVRPLCNDTPLPVYCSPQTILELRERFSYVFKSTQYGGGKPKITFNEISSPVTVGNLKFTPIPVKHGDLDIFGWRIDENAKTRSIVYLTDLNAIPKTSLQIIGSPEILIIGGLRTNPHPTHFTFDQALNSAVKIGAEQVFLTHICHDYSHNEIEAYCDNFVESLKLSGISMSPAWDGLTL